MMKTERSAWRQGGRWLGAAWIVMLCTAAPLHAEIVTATIPSTTAHFFSSHPMIAGHVVSVNDHQLVVDTEHGERITLQMDTNTLAPRDLAPGMPVRTEFAALENCRFHADRVIAVRPGMSHQRLQAYADTPESRELMASNAAMRTASLRGPDGTPYSATSVSMSGRPGAAAHGARTDAMPGTAEYDDSSRPLLSGTVQSVNDHRVVLETDQGRKVAIVMDSRTMVPRDIVSGSIVRAEFKQMQDGRFYAQRIRLVDDRVPSRAQAYASTRDADVTSAGIEGDCDSVVPTPGNATTSVASPTPDQAGPRQNGRRGGSEQVDATDRDGASDRTVTDRIGSADRTGAERAHPGSPNEQQVAANEPDHSREGTLPQTASRGPLFLLLGLLGLGSAGAITYFRTRAA